MASQILEAVRGQTSQVESDVQGDTQSYSTGGFSYRSGLGRVDAAFAEVQSTSQTASVMSVTSDNVVWVGLFSQGSGDAGSEGQQIDDETNLPNLEPINLRMYRL